MPPNRSGLSTRCGILSFSHNSSIAPRYRRGTKRCSASGGGCGGRDSKKQKDFQLINLLNIRDSEEDERADAAVNNPVPPARENSRNGGQKASKPAAPLSQPGPALDIPSCQGCGGPLTTLATLKKLQHLGFACADAEIGLLEPMWAPA